MCRRTVPQRRMPGIGPPNDPNHERRNANGRSARQPGSAIERLAEEIAQREGDLRPPDADAPTSDQRAQPDPKPEVSAGQHEAQQFLDELRNAADAGWLVSADSSSPAQPRRDMPRAGPQQPSGWPRCGPRRRTKSQRPATSRPLPQEPHTPTSKPARGSSQGRRRHACGSHGIEITGEPLPASRCENAWDTRRAMSQEKVKTVANLVDAWNERNVDGFLRFFDADCEVVFPPDVPEPGAFPRPCSASTVDRGVPCRVGVPQGRGCRADRNRRHGCRAAALDRPGYGQRDRDGADRRSRVRVPRRQDRKLAQLRRPLASP